MSADVGHAVLLVVAIMAALAGVCVVAAAWWEEIKWRRRYRRWMGAR